MSNEPASHPYRARSSNKTGPWLAGAAALALLLGGGYYAWTQTGANQSAANVAEETPYIAGPIADFGAESEAAPADNLAAAPALEHEPIAAPAAKPATTAAAAKPAKARVAAAETPVETIGVSQEVKSDEVVVTAPRRAVWTRKPNAERLAEYYPAFALDRGREGEATLNCTVVERGALKCVRISETPARAGFGNAALQVARTLRHAPQRADGSDALGTPVNLRVLFRLPENERRG